MKFYHVYPIEKFSPSRRWFVDDLGFSMVKNKYENYPKDPKNPKNRWPEFKTDEVSGVWFDFGGMMRANTPNIKTVVDGVEFELPVTHIPILIEALTCEDLIRDTYWECCTRFHNYVTSLETREKLLNAFLSEKELHEEMIEGFNKHMDAVIASTDRVISVNKYHKT